MARTRGASREFHQDDGVLLGKGGEPISPHPFGAPAPLDRQGNAISPAVAHLSKPVRMDGDTVVRGAGAVPVPRVGDVIGYRAGPDTWSRNMDAWELAHMIDMALRDPGDLGAGLVLEISIEQYGRLPGDLRRHFMAVREDMSRAVVEAEFGEAATVARRGPGRPPKARD